MKRLRKAILFAFTIIFLSSCAHVVPEEVRKTVDREITDEKIFKNPDQYRGSTVMLGGVIIDTKNTKEATYIEVLHRPLNSRGVPEVSRPSLGRFMVRSEEFLDPAVYKPGKLLTVVGQLSGRISGRIGEAEYEYPLIISKNIYLVKRHRGPAVSVGIGIFSTF